LPKSGIKILRILKTSDLEGFQLLEVRKEKRYKIAIFVISSFGEHSMVE
jgi:hypothetical protein